MKKILVLILILVMALSVSACGNKNPVSDVSGADTSTDYFKRDEEAVALTEYYKNWYYNGAFQNFSTVISSLEIPDSFKEDYTDSQIKRLLSGMFDRSEINNITQCAYQYECGTKTNSPTVKNSDGTYTVVNDNLGYSYSLSLLDSLNGLSVEATASKDENFSWCYEIVKTLDGSTAVQYFLSVEEGVWTNNMIVFKGDSGQYATAEELTERPGSIISGVLPDGFAGRNWNG